MKTDENIEGVIFQRELDEEELRKITASSIENLKRMLANLGRILLSRVNEDKDIAHFKGNYQQIITFLSIRARNPQVNNLSLHFINLVSYALIRNSKLQEAKALLKKSIQYIQAAHCDSALLSIALNNLALLNYTKKKYFKTVQIAWYAVSIIYSHIRAIHAKNTPLQQIKQKVIIFVSLLLICKNSLQKIQQNHSQKMYKHLFQQFNEAGYQTCIKYFGVDSVMTKRFSHSPIPLHLPIYKIQQQQESSHEQSKILAALNNIYDVLRSKNIYTGSQISLSQSNVQHTVKNISQINHVINTNTIYQQMQNIQVHDHLPINQKSKPAVQQRQKVQPQTKTQSQSQSQSPSHRRMSSAQTDKNQRKLDPIFQKGYRPEKHSFIEKKSFSAAPSYSQSDQDDDDKEKGKEYDVVVESAVEMNGWQLKLRLAKCKGDKLGNLLITSTNKKITNVLNIEADKLEKIASQINLQDKIPYELLNHKLEEDQFIRYSILPYLLMTQAGQLQIRPKAIGLIPPYQIKFCMQDVLIFINHIRGNSLRLCISPRFLSTSIYLSIQLTDSTLQEYFQIQYSLNQTQNAIYASLNKKNNTTLKKNIINDKCIKVRDGTKFTTRLNQIIALFEQFISNRDDQTSISQILENSSIYYKYLQIADQKGRFYQCRYLHSINAFDIFMENDYLTYCIDGMKKAKGSSMYKAHQFLADFGISLSNCGKFINAIMEIITHKYKLMTFQAPLQGEDHQRYIQNAAAQYPITQNCYHRMHIEHNSYLHTLTIGIMSINSMVPFGIKVMRYDPIQLKTIGYFIHIYAGQWKRPQKKPIPGGGSMFKHFKDQYEYKSNYFLVQWMQRGGFSRMFSCVNKQGHLLNIQDSQHKFILSSSMLQALHNT